MKWNEKSDWGNTTWAGRKNGIKFSIYDNGMREKVFYYVIAETSKNEDIILNSLWVIPKFETLEKSKEWCENLTQSELIRLREVKLYTRG